MILHFNLHIELGQCGQQISKQISVHANYETQKSPTERKIWNKSARRVCVFTLDCDALRDPGSGGANEDFRLDGSLGVSCPGTAKEPLRLASFGSSLGSGFANEALRPRSSAGLASAGFASAFGASTGLVSACCVFVSGCDFVSCVFGSGFKLSCFYSKLYTIIYT